MGAIRFDQDQIEALLPLDEINLLGRGARHLSGALVEMAEQGDQGRLIGQLLTAGQLADGTGFQDQFPIV